MGLFSFTRKVWFSFLSRDVLTNNTSSLISTQVHPTSLPVDTSPPLSLPTSSPDTTSQFEGKLLELHLDFRPLLHQGLKPLYSWSPLVTSGITSSGLSPRISVSVVSYALSVLLADGDRPFFLVPNTKIGTGPLPTLRFWG